MVDRIHQWISINCSRGWGKSFTAATAALMGVAELQALPASVPEKNVYIIAPTFDQVKDIYMPLFLYQFGLMDYGVDKNEQTGIIRFPNNTELRLISYEAVERMRGKGAYLVIWDEVSKCYKKMTPKVAWESVIRPCINTRWSQQRADAFGAPSKGRAMFLSTPAGYNFFYDLCMKHEKDVDWGYYKFDYTQSPFLDPAEVEKARVDTDPITFASEYLADFKESGNRVFYMFNRDVHVRSCESFHPSETVHCAIDFNVGKQHTTFAAVRGNQVQWLDEMSGHPDTATLAKAIKARFPNHPIIAYPDPSGRARKTSAPVGVTDFTILQNEGIRVLAKSKAPSIADSANAFNRMLQNANGDVSMYFDPKVSNMIKSVERTVWVDKADAAMIDKSGDIEHSSDGGRYLIDYLFPITSPLRVASSNGTF